MKYSLLLLIIAIFFLRFGVSSQVAPLEKYRFEDGGYIFAGIFVHHKDHALQKSIGEFYIDDIAVLNGLKKSWVFNKPQNQHACGYHYNFLVLKDSKEVNSYALNIECSELVTDDGSVYFDTRKLSTLASKIRPLKKNTREFGSANEARLFLANLKNEPDFIYAWPPRWLEYDGDFRFQTKCPADLGNHCYYTEHERELISRLQREISQKYPGEKFELKVGGGTSDGDADIIVRSNKSFEEKFDLYDRWNRTGFGKFEPYHLLLTWYSKGPAVLQKRP